MGCDLHLQLRTVRNTGRKGGAWVWIGVAIAARTEPAFRSVWLHQSAVFHFLARPSVFLTLSHKYVPLPRAMCPWEQCVFATVPQLVRRLDYVTANVGSNFECARVRDTALTARTEKPNVKLNNPVPQLCVLLRQCHGLFTYRFDWIVRGTVKDKKRSTLTQYELYNFRRSASGKHFVNAFAYAW